MWRAAIGVLLFWPGGGHTLAQDFGSTDVESVLAGGLVDSEEDLPAQVEIDDITALLLDPLDVNRATLTELARVPGLSAALALAIIDERRVRRGFNHLDELLWVQGVDAPMLLEIAPFLHVRDLPTKGDRAQDRSSEIVYRTSVQPISDVGYRAGALLRMKARFSNRARVDAVIENDPGERFRWDLAGRLWGPDFASATVELYPGRRIPSVVVGDYRVQSGQGITFGASSRSRKGTGRFTRISESPTRLRPHSSAQEYDFLRGIGIHAAPTQAVHTIVFLSSRGLDARLDTTLGRTHMTSIVETGIHRSELEMARQAAVRDHLAGGILELRKGWARVGTAGYISRLSVPFVPATDPRNHFRSRGSLRSTRSTYFDVDVLGSTFFGEYAISLEDRTNLLIGTEMKTRGRWGAALLFRSREPGFDSALGSGFAETTSSGSGERGLYLAMSIRPAEATRLSAYFDQYSFPWLKGSIRRPTTGQEWSLRLDYNLGSGAALTATWRRDVRGARVPSERAGAPDELTEARSDRVRADCATSLGSALRLRVRAEGHTRFVGNGPPATGFLAYQDLRWKAGSKMRADIRVTLFDASDAVRLYTFENDVPLSYVGKSLGGSGLSAYLLLTFELNDSLIVWSKISATFSSDRSRDIRGSLQVRRKSGS